MTSNRQTMKKNHSAVRLILLCWAFLPIVAMAEAALPLPVQSALNYRSLPPESLSVYVEDIASGEVVIEWNDAVMRNPASVEKMVTTLIALDTLGPTYRWKTDIYFLGDVQKGVLHGDLLLKGYGDPYLVTERFWQMLRRIRQAGVTRIEGDLQIDDSFFDIGLYDPGAFDRRPLRAYNVAPNALLSNFKVVRYFFEPSDADSGVNVVLEPPLANVTIDNRLRQAKGACRGYQRGITITPSDSVRKITFSGKFPSGCKLYAMDRAVLSHNEFTYGLFETLWNEVGGEISGAWKNVVVDDAELPAFSFESLPLADIIAMVNKHSNNVMARQILYTLGAEKYGPPGTEAKGRRHIEEWLDSHGMSTAELMFDNGAGLSRESRITARQLGQLLRFAWNSPYMPEYLSSLSLSGLDGTLARRFGNGPLSGKAHIKTGSLDHVSAFAGYFQARSGKRYIVAMLQNQEDVHRGPGEEVQESLLRWLYDH